MMLLVLGLLGELPVVVPGEKTQILDYNSKRKFLAQFGLVVVVFVTKMESVNCKFDILENQPHILNLLFLID